MALPNVAARDPHLQAHNAERSAINALQNLSDPDFKRNLSAAVKVETERFQSTSLSKWQAAVAGRHLKPARIVFLGDSFTWGLSATTYSYRFPDQTIRRLQEAYPSGIPGYEHAPGVLSDTPPTLPGIQGFNGGFGGATTTTYSSDAHRYGIGIISPSLVVHQVGFNDRRVDNRSPQDYGTALARELDKVIAMVPNASHILIHTSRPYDCPVEVWDQYGAQLKAVADARPDVKAVDMSQQFEKAKHVSGDPFKLIADTIHPTDAGHTLIANLLVEAMNVPPPSSDSKLVLSDTFTRPNANTLGSVEFPSNRPWTAEMGAWGVQSRRAVTLSTNAICSVETGLSDLDVSAVLRIADGSPFPGLVFRLSSSTTWLGLFLNQNAAQVNLYKNVAGSLSATVTAARVIPDGEHHVRVVAQGDRLDAYLNGEIVIQRTLTAAEMTTFGSNTRVGFWENSGVAASPGSGFWGLAVRRI